MLRDVLVSSTLPLTFLYGSASLVVSIFGDGKNVALLLGAVGVACGLIYLFLKGKKDD